MKLLWVIVLVLVAVASLIFIQVKEPAPVAIYSTETADSSSDPATSGFAAGQVLIAYQCHDGRDWEICVVNSDGSGDTKITQNDMDDLRPQLVIADRIPNDDPGSGEALYKVPLFAAPRVLIAYTCPFVICIETLGEEAQAPNVPPAAMRRAVANRFGQVVFECVKDDDPEQEPKLCHFRFNYNGEIIMTQITEPATRPSLNDSSDVAFLCTKRGVPEICTVTITFENASETSVTDDVTRTSRGGAPIGTVGEPVIGSDRIILFACGAPGPRRSLCLSDFDGHHVRIIAENLLAGDHISINDNGQIAFECYDGDQEICMINYDGSGYYQVTDNASDDMTPAINNEGLIAYGCNDGDPEICVIRTDRTGYLQVTNNESADEMPSLSTR